MKRRPRLPWINLLVVASFAAAVAAAATRPSAAADTTYLALVAGTVLAATALLARSGAPSVALGALAATTLLWALPPGAARATVLMAVLALAAAAALAERLAAEPAGLRLEAALPAAFALQVLVRSELLVDPGWLELLIHFVALPAVGAWAVVVVARRRGLAVALVAAGTLLAWSPGFTVAAVLVLAALAALSPNDLPGPGWLVRGLGPALVAALALAWEPRFAGVLAVAGALWLGRRAGAARLWPAGVASIALLFLPAAGRGLAETAGELVWLALLLPSLPFVPRERLGRIAVLLLFALGAVRFAPAGLGLAAPLALLALELPPCGPAHRLQRLWTGGLLLAAVAMAAYPWLRAVPARQALAVVGLSPAWLPAVALWAAFAVLALSAGAAARRGRGWPLAPLALGCMVLAGAWSSPSGLRQVVSRPLVLTAESLVWVAELEAPAWPARVVVDSYLANAAEIPPGAEVATVELFETATLAPGPVGGDWGAVQRWALRAGVDTGEWAVRRADLRAAGVAAPPPWLSWLAPDGRFFAQRYRARRELAQQPVHRVRLSLSPDLPPEASLAVLGLRLER